MEYAPGQNLAPRIAQGFGRHGWQDPICRNRPKRVSEHTGNWDLRAEFPARFCTDEKMVTLPSESEIAANIFAQSIVAARACQLPIGECFERAEKLKALSQRGLAIELYKQWIAFNGDSPALYAAYFNYAVELNEASDRPGAINALRECLRIKRDFCPAYINLGRALEDSGAIGQAVTQWMGLVDNLSAVNGESVKHKVLVLKQMGRVLESVHQDDN